MVNGVGRMMFASKTPRDLNRDPRPLSTIGTGRRVAVGSNYAGETVPNPRPEYDHPQHNEPNPILVKLREQRPAFTGPHAEVHAFDNANGAAWVEAGEPDDTPGSQWDAYERHAYRIIERLAALS